MPASVLDALRRRQRARKNPRSALRRVIGNWRDLIVINDEAHHAYGEKRTKKGEDSDFIRWSRIIRATEQGREVPLVVDVSATPWYGSGSPKPEGQLFEWLVCDFSVYDAFESGLVKVVRLPDPSEEGAKYLDLWDYRQGRQDQGGVHLGVPRSGRQHLRKLERGLPGVGAAVRGTAARAAARSPGRHRYCGAGAWMREHLTSDYELLRNPATDDPTDWVTIQVDSKVFDADKGNEAILREIVNTVGQPGKAGEHVRCIVSVNMLSEGWDVKNVSHILGSASLRLAAPDRAGHWPGPTASRLLGTERAARGTDGEQGSARRGDCRRIRHPVHRVPGREAQATQGRRVGATVNDDRCRPKARQVQDLAA